MVAWVWLQSPCRTSPTLSTCHIPTSSIWGKSTCLQDYVTMECAKTLEREKHRWLCQFGNNVELLTDSAPASLPSTPCEWCVRMAEQLRRFLTRISTACNDYLTQLSIDETCKEVKRGRLVQNKTSKQTGQSWCIALSTHGWLLFRSAE